MRVRISSWAAGVRRGWFRGLVVAMFPVALATIITLLVTVGGPSRAPGRHGVRDAVAGLSQGVQVPVVLSPSSTTQGPPTTEADPVTSSTTAATTTVPPTTTTTIPNCVDTQFVVSVTTDQRTYSVGQLVDATAVLENTGPTCHGPSIVGNPCVGWSVIDSQGHPVYQETAAYPGAGSCTAHVFPDPIPSGYSYSVSFAWNQQACTPPPASSTWTSNPNCQGAQVPPGIYLVEIEWWSQEPSTSISITS